MLCGWQTHHQGPHHHNLLKGHFMGKLCIAFLIAALNDLQIFAADVGNAYLNALCCKKDLDPCQQRLWQK